MGLADSIPPSALLSDVPEYLARYVRTRHSAFEELAKLIPEEELVLSYVRERDELGHRQLSESVAALVYSRVPFAKLIDSLSLICSAEYPSLLTREIASRVPSLASHEQAAVADTLFLLAAGVRPPASRVLVDRAVLRILPQFSSEAGSRLALQSFTSSRALRRRAAVKFYRIHGIDDRVRVCILGQIGTDTLEASELVAVDPDLIGILGLDYALAVAPSTFFRKCAIEVAMEFIVLDAVLECCLNYPQELVWAVFEQRNLQYCSIIVDLATTFQLDLYLLNRIIQCVAEVGNDRQFELVMAIARVALGVGNTGSSTE